MNDKRVNRRNFQNNKPANVAVSQNKRDYKPKTKDGFIPLKCKVLSNNGAGNYVVESEQTGQEIKCTLCGRIRQANIKILPGDMVWIEVSVYDLTRGRITRRI